MATDSKKLIQDLSNDLLGKLRQVVVKDNTDVDVKRTDEPKPLKKKDVIASIMREVEKIGVKRLCDSLKVVDAEAICKELKVDFKDEKIKHSRNTLSKRLRQKVAEDGLEEDLALLQTEQQKACLAALSLPEENGTPRAIAIKISAEIRKIGVEVVLSKMDLAFLRQLGEGMKLNLYDMTSQPAIIQSILTGKLPAKRARVEPKKETISKKKPKLESGITVTDMMQHYNLTELQDFARENGVQVSGKKKDLMKRIHAYFEGDSAEDTKPAKKAKVEKKEKKEDKKEKKEDKKEKKEDKKETKKDKKEKEDEKEEKETPKSPKKGKKDTKSKKEEKEEKEEEAEEKEEVKETPKSPKKGKAKKGKDEKEVGER